MTDQRGIEAAKKAFYRNMDPGLGVEEAISAYLATTEPGNPESGRRPVDLPRAYIDAVSAYRRYDDDFNGDGLMAAVKTVLSLSALHAEPCEPVAWQYRYRHRNPNAIWGDWGDRDLTLGSYQDYEEQGRPLYASPAPALGVDIEALQRRVEELEAALEFYADELTWIDTNPKDDGRITVLVSSPSFAEIDRGKVAREVLVPWREGVKP